MFGTRPESEREKKKRIADAKKALEERLLAKRESIEDLKRRAKKLGLTVI